jgi:hypothetical protein
VSLGDVVTESDAILHQETMRPTVIEAPRKRPGLASIAIAVIALVASTAWWAAARISLSRGITHQDERALENASIILGDKLHQVGARLEGECALISQDPRIRFALSSAHDEATLVDLLGDIKRPLGVDVIALLNAEAHVLASVGQKEMTGLDLGSSRLIMRAVKDAKATSDVWGFGDRLLAVSASAVLVDGQPMALVVVAASLGEKAFQSVYDLTGTAGALLIQDKIAGFAPKELDDAFAIAVSLAPGADATIAFKEKWLHARSEEIADKALPARVLWLRPVEKERSDYESLLALLWIPMLGATVLGCAAAWRHARLRDLP